MGGSLSLRRGLARIDGSHLFLIILVVPNCTLLGVIIRRSLGRRPRTLGEEHSGSRPGLLLLLSGTSAGCELGEVQEVPWAAGIFLGFLAQGGGSEGSAGL